MTSAVSLLNWQTITNWKQTEQFRGSTVAIKTENETWKGFSKYKISDGADEIFFGSVTPRLVKIWREGTPFSETDKLLTAIAEPKLEGKTVFMRLATMDELSKIEAQRHKLCKYQLGGATFTYKPTRDGLQTIVHFPHYR